MLAALIERLFLCLQSKVHIMTRDELVALVSQIRSDTLIARRMYDALGLPCPIVQPRRTKYDEGYRYRGARKLMKQRHGVKL